MKDITAGVPKLRRTDSGLYVPHFSAAANNLMLPGTAPSDADLIGGYPTEADLGFRTSTLKDVRAALRGVAFEQGLIAASLLNANVYLFRHDREQQLRLAKRIYEPELFEAIARSIVRFPESFPFSEQNCFILQRLLIDEAVEVTASQEPSPDDLRTVVHSAISCASVSGQAAEESTPKVGQPLANWLAFNIQSGAYFSDRLLAVEVTRAQELFARLAELPDLKDSRFPIDMWCQEDYGFSVSEQMNLGLSTWFLTNTTSPHGPFSVHIKPDEFNDLLAGLGWLDRRQQALDLISAPREQMQEEFAEAGHDIASVVWETRPFMRHPFLRCQDDGLVLLSPRAMQSWLGDGFHYRLLESAQSRSQSDAGQTSHQFSAYAGRLLEAYAVELTESAHQGQRTVGGGRVFGDQVYGTGGQKRTSDLLVDLGQDIILVEISASRLRADTLILGDTKNVEKDLDRMLISKIKQLDRCVSALTAGTAKIPDLDLDQVSRLWPIVVTAGKIMQTAPLWEYLDIHAGQCLKQPRVQPLTLLDIEDYERLLAIVEQGHAMHELLAKKCAPEFHRFELRVWLASDARAPRATKLPQRLADALEGHLSHIA